MIKTQGKIGAIAKLVGLRSALAAAVEEAVNTNPTYNLYLDFDLDLRALRKRFSSATVLSVHRLLTTYTNPKPKPTPNSNN